MKIRLKEVAVEAAVSVTCASLALANHPRISEATREKVRAAARRLGYVPNPAARALRLVRDEESPRGLLGSLAMIIPAAVMAQTDRPHIAVWLSRYERESQSAGYLLGRFAAPATPSAARTLDRTLYHRGISGVIVAAANATPTWEIRWDRFAVVANSWPHPCPFHAVGGDRFQDLFLLTQKLVERGYRRPGLIHPGHGFEGWLGGFSAALLEHKLARTVPPLKLREWDGAPALRWFQRYQPDVIVANHGLDLVRDFAKAGVSIPTEVGYCSPDVLPESPGLAGLVQPRAEVARLTIDLLHGHLRRHETGRPSKPLNIAFPPDWVEGATLRPLLNR